MKKKRTIIMRENVEDKIKQSIEHPITIVYDWMYDLDLPSTSRDVYAYIFDRCRVEPLRPILISTKEMSNKLGITISQCNFIKQNLVNAKLIFVSTKGNKTYYSLYHNSYSA